MPFTDLNIAWPMRDLTAQAKIASGQGTGPEDYQTGGEDIVLADLGLSEVWWWAPVVATDGVDIIMALYDPATAKLKFFDMAGAEIANGEDLSDYTYTFFATGK